MRRRLVLVGGGAGSGKTTLARRLAAELGASWLQLDTLWRFAVEAAAPDSPTRDVLDIDAHLRRAVEPVDGLVARHVSASEAIGRALPAALAVELGAHETVVADGVWILPAWAATLSIADVAVSSVFVHEPDHERLHAALAGRRGEPLHDWHATSTAVAVAYGDLVAREARRVGLPVAAARPWDDAVLRARASLGL